MWCKIHSYLLWNIFITHICWPIKPHIALLRCIVVKFSILYLTQNKYKERCIKPLSNIQPHAIKDRNFVYYGESKILLMQPIQYIKLSFHTSLFPILFCWNYYITHCHFVHKHTRFMPHPHMVHQVIMKAKSMNKFNILIPLTFYKHWKINLASWLMYSLCYTISFIAIFVRKNVILSFV